MYNLENKICSFNVNEYHLATILMPYIYETINEGNKIITFFEKDLRDVCKKVINTNSMFWKNKEVFDSVEWRKLEIEKISEKFKLAEDNDIVIVAGKEEFIEKINRLVLNFHTNFTLVNCFEINELNKNLEEQVKKYSKILNTKGLKEIKEVYLV